MKVVYPGTFDPLTFGHEDLVRRASRLFDTVVVAIADSEAKRPFFSAQERIEMARDVLRPYANVEVTGFSSLLMQFVQDQGAQAILRAEPSDIVLTERISGVPVAVIKTPYVEKVGTQASPLMKRALRHPKLKHYARMYYSVKSVFELRRASLNGVSYKDFFQAGKSVGGIEAVLPAGEIVRQFAAAARERAA